MSHELGRSVAVPVIVALTAGLLLGLASPEARAGVSVHFAIGYGYHGGHYYHHPYHGYRHYGYGHYGYRHHYHGHHGYHLGYLLPFVYHHPHHYYDRWYSRSQSHAYAPSYSARDRGSYRPAIRDASRTRSSSLATVRRDGWTLLELGRSAEAVGIFGAAAARFPGDGAPETGYSIASAASGDLERGVQAMRRALSIDPDALHDMKLRDGVRPVVVELVNRYEAGGVGSVSDDAFMLAALYYMLHHRESARAAIDEARAAGDHSTSAVNLERLLGERSGETS